MIINSYLRKIVKESGRREITTSMIVEAEKAEWKARRDPHDLYINALSRQNGLFNLQQQQAGGMAAAPDSLGSLLGGALGSGLYIERCPYCGK